VLALRSTDVTGNITNMNSELIDVSPTRKEIKIEIDLDAIRAEYNRVSNTFASKATIPGFRPGRAPVDVVQRHYRKEIGTEVLRNLLPKAVQDAINGYNLHPIGEPEIHFETPPDVNRPFDKAINLHAHIEVFPEVTLGNYKGLELVRRTRPVTEADIETLLTNLRNEHSSLQPVEDRPAQLGDIISVDLRGKFIQNPEEEDINVEDVEIELGGNGIVKEFNDNLIGTRPDDERTFVVNYAEDFNAKGLAGKQVEYTAKVTAIRVKEIPELNDEWAKSLGDGIENVESLRNRISSVLEASAKHESDQRLQNDLISQLLKDYPVEVPASLVKKGVQNLYELTLRRMIQQGINPRDPEIDWDDIGNRLYQEAEGQIRTSLILEHIAQAENIEVSNEEIEAEIQAMAERSQQSIEQVRASLTKDNGERSIASRVRLSKTVDLLINNAQVTEAEWKEEVEVKQEEAKSEESGQQGEQAVSDTAQTESTNRTDEASSSGD
jgi:trigger factor